MVSMCAIVGSTLQTLLARGFLIVALGLFGSLAWSALHEPAIPITLVLVGGAMFAVTAIAPEWGLASLALVLPLAAPIQLDTNAGIGLTETAELLVIAFVIPAATRLLFQRDLRAGRFEVALFVLSLFIVASTAVHLVEQLRSSWWSATVILSLHVTHNYFVEPNGLRGVHSAMCWIEGIALAVVTARIMSSRPLSTHASLTAMLLGGP